MEIFVNINQVKTKKRNFSYFGGFFTRALTLRPRNTYIYVFRALFGFSNFQATLYKVLKLGVKSQKSKLNFE